MIMDIYKILRRKVLFGNSDVQNNKQNSHICKYLKTLFPVGRDTLIRLLDFYHFFKIIVFALFNRV